MFERCLVEFCYATLAGLKTGSLFTVEIASRDEMEADVREWNERLAAKGVCVIPMRVQGSRALIYVYRASMLRSDLCDPEICAFLDGYDYGKCGVSCAIRRLRSRFADSDEFPHEIGVFLGYPIGDVKGFIENKGKNSKCTGCWKVYCDKCKAEKTFLQYRKCKSAYLALYDSGKSVEQLTVAV